MLNRNSFLLAVLPGIQSNYLLNSVAHVWYVKDTNAYHNGFNSLYKCNK